MKRMQACVWRNGSTSKESMRSELPTYCRTKKCDGLMTEGIMKSCDRYMQDGSINERVITYDRKKMQAVRKED